MTKKDVPQEGERSFSKSRLTGLTYLIKGLCYSIEGGARETSMPKISWVWYQEIFYRSAGLKITPLFLLVYLFFCHPLGRVLYENGIEDAVGGDSLLKFSMELWLLMAGLEDDHFVPKSPH